MTLTVKQKAEIENALVDYGIGRAYEEYDGYSCHDTYVWNGTTLTATFEFLKGGEEDNSFGGMSEEVAEYVASNPPEAGEDGESVEDDDSASDDDEYVDVPVGLLKDLINAIDAEDVPCVREVRKILKGLRE
jgi:hypothetical protein